MFLWFVGHQLVHHWLHKWRKCQTRTLLWLFGFLHWVVVGLSHTDKVDWLWSISGEALIFSHQVVYWRFACGQLTDRSTLILLGSAELPESALWTALRVRALPFIVLPNGRLRAEDRRQLEWSLTVHLPVFLVRVVFMIWTGAQLRYSNGAADEACW